MTAYKGCFTEVLRLFQGSFKGVPRKFQGCSKVARVFHGTSKGVVSAFQGCFKIVSMVFQESCMDFTWKIERCFEGVLRVF